MQPNNIQTNSDVHKMLMESIPEISDSNSISAVDNSQKNLDNSKE